MDCAAATAEESRAEGGKNAINTTTSTTTTTTTASSLSPQDICPVAQVCRLQNPEVVVGRLPNVSIRAAVIQYLKISS